jgi:hypothetical protein
MYLILSSDTQMQHSNSVDLIALARQNHKKAQKFLDENFSQLNEWQLDDVEDQVDAIYKEPDFNEALRKKSKLTLSHFYERAPISKLYSEDQREADFERAIFHFAE